MVASMTVLPSRRMHHSAARDWCRPPSRLCDRPKHRYSTELRSGEQRLGLEVTSCRRTLESPAVSLCMPGYHWTGWTANLGPSRLLRVLTQLQVGASWARLASFTCCRTGAGAWIIRWICSNKWTRAVAEVVESHYRKQEYFGRGQ
jgi:hypothetical protein